MTTWRDHPVTVSLVVACVGLTAQAMLVGRWTAGVETSILQVDKRVDQANADRADRRADSNNRIGAAETRITALEERGNTARLALQSLDQKLQQFIEMRELLIDRYNAEIRAANERIASIQRQIDDGRGPVDALKSEINKIQADLAVIKDQLSRMIGPPWPNRDK